MHFEIDGKTSPINLPKANVVKLYLEDGSLVTVRPSGTEPKVKFYIGMKSEHKLEKEFADKLYNDLKAALGI